MIVVSALGLHSCVGSVFHSNNSLHTVVHLAANGLLSQVVTCLSSVRIGLKYEMFK